MDDNEEIIRTCALWYPHKEAIEARLAIGIERYGHGVRVEDDTTQWGTKTNSWLDMGLEEIDDLVIYVIAECIRESRKGPQEPWLRSRNAGLRLEKYVRIINELNVMRVRLMDLMNNVPIDGTTMKDN